MRFTRPQEGYLFLIKFARSYTRNRCQRKQQQEFPPLLKYHFSLKIEELA
uniref:Uncharacterized protein n=1 Tax=Anguilla anguilla TaxID=7936 RepID=A0A0E9VIZ4_ANGAN